MKKALLIMAISAMTAGCADNSLPKAQLPELDKTNPLLVEWDTPYATPPFSKIELKHYEPAFDAAIAVNPDLVGAGDRAAVDTAQLTQFDVALRQLRRDSG